MSDERKVAFEVKWRIENLRSWLQPRDDSLYSPQFLVETLSNSRWRLRLTRKWQLEEKYISLALERDAEDDQPKPIVLNYQLSFLTFDESPLKSKSCTSKFSPKTVGEEVKVTGIEVLGEKKDAYLPEGVLTVSCKLWIATCTIIKRGQCSIRTVIGRKCVTLEGTIDYFSQLNYTSNAIVNFMSPSSDISFISFDVQLKQCFENYLNGYSYMKFERREVVCKCFSFYSCKLFVLDANGKQSEFIQNNNCLQTLLNSNKSCTFRSYNFESNEFLKNDTLTLKIEITYNPGVEYVCVEYGDKHKKMTDGSAVLENMNTCISRKVNSNPSGFLHLPEKEDKTCIVENNESNVEDECFDAVGKVNLPSTSLKEDLTSLYEDRLFCDTNLRTDSETFPAHRSVLSARSPVFKKMFTTDMKEKAGECINVPDISSDTVRRLLQFLYTDCTGDLDMQSAKDLYIAADKYEIASLKHRCSAFMKENLCPANVCEVLVLADMHQDKNLESATQEYVLNYYVDVFSSDEWKLFMENYGSLAAKVMYLKCMKDN